MMLDRRALLLTGAAGIAQIGKRAQPRVTPAQLLRQTHVPALGALVVPAKGEPTVSVMGRRRDNAGTQATADDLWLIGSNTQSFTAALYARTVEQNRANWRASVPELFPDLTPDPAWRAITVEDLMRHTSGLDDEAVSTPDFLAGAAVDPRPLTVQRTDFAKLLLAKPPPGEPGRYAYAASNSVLVGAAIERATRMSWESAISGELFTPLGLTSAGFGAPSGAEPWGHHMLGPRAVPVNPSGTADDPPVFGPANRLHLSLGDYAVFLRLFLTGGGGYLTQDTLTRLADPRSDSGEGPALGWIVSPERGWARGPVLSAATSGGFWSADAAIGPARGIAVAAVCNAGGTEASAAVDRLGLSLLQPFAAS